MGYRPNETVWFKTTVINNALTEANTDTGMQGALLIKMEIKKKYQNIR